MHTVQISKSIYCPVFNEGCSPELNTGKYFIHFDGLSPQWGEGFWTESTFHIFVLFTFNVKIMPTNWKIIIIQW